MLTFVYISKSQNIEFENHLRERSGFPKAEVLHYSQSNFAKAYNKALKKAKNDLVVFVRSDIHIETENFGPKLVDNFQRSQFSIIGIVGSTIVPMSGLVWEKEEPLVGRIWYEQSTPDNENRFSEVFRNKVIPVVVVDDCFFAVNRKKLVATFDPSFLSDSFYDFDFCVKNYEKGLDVGVTFDVKVVKLGLNDKDEKWKLNQKRFVEKHSRLPYRLKPKIFISNGPVKIERFPKVSIIVPHKDKPIELASCLESMSKVSNYPNFELFVVDMGSKAEALQEVEEFVSQYPNAQLIQGQTEHLPTIYEEVISNHISKDSELLCFIDKDVILLNDAISRMVKVYLEDPESCGTLGVRMHMKNNMVRHAGLQLLSTETQEGFELGLGFHGFQSAYRYKNKVVKNVLGGCRDFLMVPRNLYEEIGGFNKEYLYSLEDFELNLTSIRAGKKNHIIGSAVCYYTGVAMPKFLPDDFLTLVNFVNQHVEVVTPYVDLVNVS